MQKCPCCAEEILSDAIRCRHCHVWLAPPPPKIYFTPFSRPLTRSRLDRMVTGVCGGVGQYLNIDPTVVRTLSVLVACFTAILPGLAAYIVLSFVIPKASET